MKLYAGIGGTRPWAETFRGCERHVGGAEVLVELVTAIGTWHMISTFLRSLEIPLEEGVAAWPPDGQAPA